MLQNLDRRQFLKSTAVAGGMLMTVNLPTFAKNEHIKNSGWSVYLNISRDNVVTLSSPVSDMGQHMKTTGPMMLAEELDLDWNSVRFSEDCRTYLTRNSKDEVIYQYADMNSGGSHAARQNWDFMRRAGATTRQMLLEEAAEVWQVDLESLRTEATHVLHPVSGKKLSYGSLAAGAAKRHVNPDNVNLKPESEFKIIGKNIHTIDLLQMVTGKPLYSLDADYMDVLHAVIDRAPAHGASIKSFNEKDALIIPGVKKIMVIEPQMSEYQPGEEKQVVAAGVAVIAESLWAAMQGKKALGTQWQPNPAWDNESSEEQMIKFRSLVGSDTPIRARKNDGDIDKALAEATIVIDEVYETPLWAHVCMEPFSCIADIREHDATIVVGHQFPEKVARTIESLTGIDALKVEVINKRMGGGFGRRWETDFVREAVSISSTMKQAVKVTWMREDEIEQDFFAPAMAMRIRAGMDDKQTVTAWHHRQVSTREAPRDDCFPYKLVKNFRSESFKSESKIPTGAWRGPGHLQWAFAAESMTDELAAAADIDPLEFRLAMLRPYRAIDHKGYGADIIDSGRMALCYESAASMARWGRKMPERNGLGISGHFTFGSYAAFVVEVSVNEEEQLTIHEAWGAIDCGFAINPNHIRNQMEGGFLEGLNAALQNKANMVKGQVQNNNFHNLPWLKMAQTPRRITVDIIKNGFPPTGVGEPPTAPAAAALTNAIFAATGQRIRTLPVSQSMKV